MNNIINDTINNAETYEAKPEMETRRMSDIETTPVKWLWYRRIALGKLTVIAGNPGLGKSQITAFLAATVSTGGYWPDGAEPTPPAASIFLSAEDDAGDTIKPRLLAAGADVANCYIIDAVYSVNQHGGSQARTFDLSQDIERLEREIIRIGNVRLVIIDPISAYLGGTDSHNNADMRGMLAPLSAMAARHDVAIVLVTHMNKSKDQEPIARVIGSIGLIAAARAGYVVIKDDKNPKLRHFVPVKNNIGNDEDGFSFMIDPVELQDGFLIIETSKVSWLPDTVRAQDILNPEVNARETQINGAKDFLTDYLADGPKLSDDVFEEASGAGYKKGAIQRAAQALGVKRRKQPVPNGQWEMYLSAEETRKAYTRTEESEDGEETNFSELGVSD